LKGLGYLVSIASVFLLGIVAWPKPDEPLWKALVTVAGMAASIVGMGLRYWSHRKEKREIDRFQLHATPDRRPNLNSNPA
jgi:membrane protein DedA with SNARE-associated domain